MVPSLTESVSTEPSLPEVMRARVRERIGAPLMRNVGIRTSENRAESVWVALMITRISWLFDQHSFWIHGIRQARSLGRTDERSHV